MTMFLLLILLRLLLLLVSNFAFYIMDIIRFQAYYVFYKNNTLEYNSDPTTIVYLIL
jgi:hypothetical protein